MNSTFHSQAPPPISTLPPPFPPPHAHSAPPSPEGPPPQPWLRGPPKLSHTTPPLKSRGSMRCLQPVGKGGVLTGGQAHGEGPHPGRTPPARTGPPSDSCRGYPRKAQEQEEGGKIVVASLAAEAMRGWEEGHAGSYRPLKDGPHAGVARSGPLGAHSPVRGDSGSKGF